MAKAVSPHLDRLAGLARRASGPKSDSKTTSQFLRELVQAFEDISAEHTLLKLFGDIMRALIDQVKGVLADLDKARTQNTTDAATIATAQAQATTDAATIADLQAKLAAAGTPTDPNDVIASTDPVRSQMDAILDADAGTTQPAAPPQQQPPAPPVEQVGP